MKSIKKSIGHGCTFLGKGIIDHPEMGVVVECRQITFDDWDPITSEWKGDELITLMYWTDNDFSFVQDDLDSGRFQIELYAPNIR